MKKERGFIGPIGDDLPSLIPILFALVIFFASFTSTFQRLDKGTREFSNAISLLEISDRLRGDRYMNNAEEFKELCNGITNVGSIYYKVGIVKLPMNESLDIVKFVNENQGILVVDGEIMQCTNMDQKIRTDTKVLVRKFPFAFQDSTVHSGFAIRPMLLVVVLWD